MLFLETLLPNIMQCNTILYNFVPLREGQRGPSWVWKLKAITFNSIIKNTYLPHLISHNETEGIWEEKKSTETNSWVGSQTVKITTGR